MTAQPKVPADAALSSEELNACWRIVKYLAVGQIYLLDNPLLREPHRAPNLSGKNHGPSK